MTPRMLGMTNLRITPIGIGAWAIGGGKWEFGWGAQDDAQSIAAIHAALDRGLNWIDTAAAYGLGHSEKIVGAAVRGYTTRPYIFTKCSLVWDESGNISHNLRADSIRREAEASLKRLGIDAIDLYLLAHVFRNAHRHHDARADCIHAQRRLAERQCEFPGAAALP